MKSEAASATSQGGEAVSVVNAARRLVGQEP